MFKRVQLNAIFLCCSIFIGCESQELKSHREMIRILAEKADRINPEINLYANKKRLAWLQNQRHDDNISATLQHQAVIANELLNAGYTYQAI